MSGAALAMAAASAAAQVKAQQDAASVQSQSNERQYQTTMATYANNNAQVNLAGQQLRDQTIQKQMENNIAAEKGMGKATAASGVSGVGGNSVEALLGDLSGTQTRYNNSVLANYDSGTAALENQRQNTWASAASTINGLKTPVLPDYMSAGLKITNAAASYSASGSKDPTTPATVHDYSTQI
jgi:hypothetical protein